MEARYKALSKSNMMLVAKTEDLESRSRHQNLRVFGIMEDLEGPHATTFMTHFCAELLGTEDSGSSPMLDIAHRSLAPKPKRGVPPHPMVKV